MVQEHLPQEDPPYSNVVKRVIELEGGYLIVQETPGLGVELDVEGVWKHPPRQTGRRSRPSAR